MIAIEILAKGFAWMPFKVPLKEIGDAIAGLESLSEQPEEIQIEWMANLADSDQPNDDGLINKSKGPGRDKKYFFHFRTGLIEDLVLRGVNTTPYDKFLQACAKIKEQCDAVIVPIYEELDRLIPGYDLGSRIQPHASTLRVLSYLPDPKNYTGEHIDRSGLTVHLYESQPGLCFLEDPGVYESRDDAARVFPGARMQLVTNEKVMASVHYARNSNGNIKRRSACTYFSRMDTSPHSEREVIRLVQQVSEYYASEFRR